MKRWAWLCVAWMSTGSLAAATLTIATYNLENYVAADRMVDGVYRPNYPKPEAAKAAVRAVIRQIDADVLVLLEMGPAPYLTELQRDLADAGTPYPHAALLEGADADRHVAVLARVPFRLVAPHAGLVFRYRGEMEAVKRGVLEVGFDTPQGPLTVWAVHLKSRYTDEPEDPASAARRNGEARAVRDFILARIGDAEGALFVIAGDFNDAKNSPAVRAFMQRGEREFAQLVPAADSRGEHWTYHYRKEDAYSRVDHILVSTALQSFVGGGAVLIADNPAVRAASDHRPVVVTLQFDGAPQAAATTSQATAATSATARD